MYYIACLKKRKKLIGIFVVGAANKYLHCYTLRSLLPQQAQSASFQPFSAIACLQSHYVRSDSLSIFLNLRPPFPNNALAVNAKNPVWWYFFSSERESRANHLKHALQSLYFQHRNGAAWHNFYQIFEFLCTTASFIWHPEVQ